MSYQVLARKWRPQNFQQMVGQEHVLKALANALDQDRLHHAYLFSGTRGVGKTTIARIFAKSLNCEQGITSQPCGQCAACLEIVEGRFVDLIEIDAASRTKVEDMRELLDNVQYAPTRSRYKIYLIDEVHMLSNSSFNALLKTLEEPPPHIKFLLATTDPQKLPVTVLSRCLQFNLKNLSPERIVKHLTYILNEEQVSGEDAALWELAKAADGSMRDALSLTDQCIAFGNGAITHQEVLEMLGTIEKHVVLELLQMISDGDAAKVLGKVSEMAVFSPDYAFILQAMAELLHRIAIEQLLPGAIDNSFGDQHQVSILARKMTAEDTQLYYEIAVISRRDIALAPDARTGFEMALLRMLTFRPNMKSGQQPAHLNAAAPGERPAAKAKAAQNADNKQPPENKQSITDQSAANLSAVNQPAVNQPASKQPEQEGELSSAERQFGQVGEDLVKSELYEHPVKESADIQVIHGQKSNDQANSKSVAINPGTRVPAEPIDTPPDMPLPPLEAYGDAEFPIKSLASASEPLADINLQATTAPITERLADTDHALPQILNAPVAEPADGLPTENIPEQWVAVASTAALADSHSDAGVEEEADAELEEDEIAELEEEISVAQVDFDVSQLGGSASAAMSHEPLLLTQRWSEVIGKLNLSGMTYSLCQRLVLHEVLGERLEFIIDEDHFDFFNQLQQNRLTDALADFTGKPVRVLVTPGHSKWLSPLQAIEARRAELQAAAEQEIHADRNVRELIELFDASVVENSIEPVISNEKTG